MANEAQEEEATRSKPGRLLCSDGQREAQAYATTELRDAPPRPTVEMDRVQVNDPSTRPTAPGARQRAAAAARAAEAANVPRFPAAVPAAPAPEAIARGAEAPAESNRIATPPPPPGEIPSAGFLSELPDAPLDPALESDPPSHRPPLSRRSHRSRQARQRIAAASVAAVLLLAAGVRFRLDRRSDGASPLTSAATRPVMTGAPALVLVADVQAPEKVVAPAAPDPPRHDADDPPPELGGATKGGAPNATVAAPAYGAKGRTTAVTTAAPTSSPATQAEPRPAARPPPAAAPAPSSHRLFGLEE